MMFHVKQRDDLPRLEPDDFARRLIRACRTVSGAGFPGLSTATARALHAHYTELRRWNRRIALIGSGTVSEVLERHYAESLAALPLLPPPVPEGAPGAPRVLVDLGSGAGFPGWVLAAARPDLVALLVEARERKWAFLQAATRRAEGVLRAVEDLELETPARPVRATARTSLPIECLNARVNLPLPEALPSKMDIVTVRALKLDPRALAALARRVPRQGRFLLWLGAEMPGLPSELTAGRERALGGSERRRILELVPAT